LGTTALRYETNATICRNTKHKTWYYTNFWNDKFTQVVSA
jgi:hypothetical protein